MAFSIATDRAIPVIADPEPPIGGNSHLGDINLAFEVEPKLARDLCRSAWQSRFPGRPGITVVNARSFDDEPATFGAAPGSVAGLYVAGRKFGSGKRGDDLCGIPVRLTKADVSEQFVVMVDQDRLAHPVNVLAHELGHTLFLGHGNGLDDNHDGRSAGTRGPRRYDEYCDPDWLLAPQNTQVAEDQSTPSGDCARSSSLMNIFGTCLNLRPLQVETARGVALVVPGAVDGAERPKAKR